MDEARQYAWELPAGKSSHMKSHNIQLSTGNVFFLQENQVSVIATFTIKPF